MDDQSRKTTLWFIVGFAVLVIAAVIIFAALSGSSGSASQNFVATVAPPVTAADWKEGSPSSTVSVIEYGDFECPACNEYQPMVKQLISDYSSKILFVFRNFPLYAAHPDAQVSSEAAEAAGLQGKYWQMHDLLYEKQTEWAAVTPGSVTGQYFNGYAQSLGLNVSKFDADMNATSVLQKIQTDVNGGNDAKLDHTPTFFVNLKQIPNPGSYNDLKKAIDAALASSSAPVAK